MDQSMFIRATATRVQVKRLLKVIFCIATWVVTCSAPVWAESGNSALAEEFFAKGLDYYWAQEMPLHYEEAFVWLSKAADYDHPRAQAIVADMYGNGLGTVIDHEKAFALATAAAGSGDVFGRYLLGKYYYWGRGTLENEVKAKKIFSQIFLELESLAESGDGLAQHGLGWVYDNFSTTTKDYQKAHHWYENAAVQGYAVAQNNLGVMFGRGNGVRKNSKAQRIWYRQAVEQNYPVAQYNLALALEDTRDLDGKYHLLIQAANRNYGPAQAKLGWMFEKGEGRPVEWQSAISWYRKAAIHGHRWAQNHLGILYKKGKGVPQDYHEAMNLFRTAADKGYPKAFGNIGRLYEKGLGVERNYAVALVWYAQGAELDNAYSQARLGYLYMNGFGLDKDYEKANKWLKKAARGGNEWARYGIGFIHEKQRQYSKAIGWYLLSALNGYEFGLKRAVYLLVMYPVISFQV
jgi:TPR repeat protein